MNLRTCLAATALAFAASAHAGGFDGPYVALSAGSSQFKTDKGQIDNALTGAGVQSLSSSLDDTDTGYKIDLGYQYNPNFAFELGYVDLGKAKYSATGTIGGSAASGSGTVKASGVTMSLLGIAPINDAFSVFGRIGVIDAKVQVQASAASAGGSASGSASATKPKWNYGIGASYNVTRGFAVRAEYEVFNSLGDEHTGKGNVDLLSVGLVVRF